MPPTPAGQTSVAPTPLPSGDTTTGDGTTSTTATGSSTTLDGTVTQPEATLPPKEYADGEVTVATGDGQNVTVTYTKDGEVTLDGAEGDVAVGRDTIEIDFGDDDGKVVLIDRETGEVTRSDTDTFGAAVQPTCEIGRAHV